MREDEFANIASLEGSHWWYRNLHRFVLKEITKYSSEKGIHIVDAGCGTGGLLHLLQQHHYYNSGGFDISDHAVKYSTENGVNCFQGDLKDISKFYHIQSADIIISNDNLYFLSEYDRQLFMHDVYGILKPGGLLIVNLPYSKWFEGIHDKQVGITKRIGKKDLKEMMKGSGFELVRRENWPYILSPLILLVRIFHRLIKMKGSKIRIASDLKKEPRLLNELFYLITKGEDLLPWRKSFGSSLFFVAKKPVKIII